MPTTTDLSEPTIDREFVNTRVFEHSRPHIFDAFHDPALLAQWWGPKDFRNTFEIFEFRPEGRWKFVMHGPDGRDYPNESVFLEIVSPARIVFDHIGAPKFRMTITLEDLDLKTRLTWHMLFDSAATREGLKGIIPECNEQNFDRLENLLSRTRPKV